MKLDSYLCHVYKRDREKAFVIRLFSTPCIAIKVLTSHAQQYYECYELYIFDIHSDVLIKEELSLNYIYMCENLEYFTC